MITVTLSASLSPLLPEQVNQGHSTRCSITLDADKWTDLVKQLSNRFSKLADRAFDDSGQLRSGMVIAINDEVFKRGDGFPQVKPGDEVYLFQQIAGGGAPT